MSNQNDTTPIEEQHLYKIFLTEYQIQNMSDHTTTTDLIKVMKNIDQILVLSEFDDDHVKCYRLLLVVDGQRYTHTLWWAGAGCARMLYQSEISDDMRNSSLKLYFADIILDQEL